MFGAGVLADMACIVSEWSMPPLLTDGEIDAALAELPHWRRTGQSLVRTIEAPTFPDAIALVDRVAVVAEEADHHPDIDIRWRKVIFAASTHSAGGITESDLVLARRIDEEARRAGL